MRIEVKKGIIVLDACFAWLLDEHRFRVFKPAKSHTHYVSIINRKTRKYVGLLHCVVCPSKKGYVTDHINGNGLDNRRKNLRSIKQYQNQQNRRPTTGRQLPKGVYYRKDRGYYIARITHQKMIINLGSFATLQAAAEARLAAEIRYFTHKGKGTAQ